MKTLQVLDRLIGRKTPRVEVGLHTAAAEERLTGEATHSENWTKRQPLMCG